MRAASISASTSRRHVLPMLFPGSDVTHSTTTSADTALVARTKRTGTPLVDQRVKLAHTPSTNAGCHPRAARAGWMKTRTGRSKPRFQRARAGRATSVTSAGAVTRGVGCAVAFTLSNAALTYSGTRSGIERRTAAAEATSRGADSIAVTGKRADQRTSTCQWTGRPRRVVSFSCCTERSSSRCQRRDACWPGRVLWSIRDALGRGPPSSSAR